MDILLIVLQKQKDEIGCDKVPNVLYNKNVGYDSSQLLRLPEGPFKRRNIV